MKKNQKGFGAIEGLLILVIVGLIGFVGWYVFHAKTDTDKSLSSAAASSAATSSTKQTTASSSQPKSNNAGNPSASDIQAAHAAMIADCQKNYPSDTCASSSQDDKTAPNFVEGSVGANVPGEDIADAAYVALAKDIGGKWTVIWSGQSCIPKTTASQYAIPSVFNVCLN